MNIAAISTPAGVGGIAVIRVSGPDAFAIVDAHFRPFKVGHAIAARQTHTLTFGQFFRLLEGVGEVEPLDEVVVAKYSAPHSFTGENVAEISCHGSLYIQQEILASLCVGNSVSDGVKVGSCRLAEPGEFTRRAFQHGRMDLSQAEAVADLIAAQSAGAHRLAMNQMRGSISRKLDQLHDQLLHLNSLLVLELDFSEEEVEFADRAELQALAEEIDAEVCRLADTFRTGQAIKNGVPVSIIGAPNVGKSTLLNALLKDDRAIVSPIQGTTRDLIEDTISLEGILFRFIDTAGIRHTDDLVEQMGIERSLQALQRAQIVLLMTEPGVEFPAVETQPDQHVIHILNKVDMMGLPSIATLDYPSSHISLSAKSGAGIEVLESALVACVEGFGHSQGDVILTNARHHEALVEAHHSLQHVLEGLASHLSGDLVAEDLNATIYALNSILGRSISTQDTLNNIFKNFCIGK